MYFCRNQTSQNMADKGIIKRLILEYQKLASSAKIIERDINIDYSANNVFVGLRRAGKSFLMFQCIQKLIKNGHSINEILYFNFEDDRIDSLKLQDLDTIKLCYEETFYSKPIFFLDEIQLVDGWEKFARRLADTGYQVFVTGSNAKMLSSEIATTLGGRFYIKEVFPFSFKEFLDLKGIKLEENWQYLSNTHIIRNFEQYFKLGGLPEVIKTEDIFKREWLSSLFNKIYFNDLIARYSIRNEKAIKMLIRKLADSIMQPVTYNRAASVVTASGYKVKPDTIAEYCGYIQDTWLMFSIENFAAKLSEKASTPKYYFLDNGFISLFVNDADTTLLENLVAITLRKRYPGELTYFSTNIEVDFYLPERKESYQVAYSIQDPQTFERETRALVKLNSFIQQNKMYIITKDDERTLEIDGSKIEVVPIWKWLI